MPKPHSQGGNRDRFSRPDDLTGKASDTLAKVASNGSHDDITIGGEYADGRRKRWAWRELIDLGESLLRRHGLEGWSFDVQNLSNTNLYPDLGPLFWHRAICDCDRKLIALDAEWSYRPRTLRELTHVILHEIAHALIERVGEEHDHDAVWAAKAIRIGCSRQFVTSCLQRALWLEITKATSKAHRERRIAADFAGVQA